MPPLHGIIAYGISEEKRKKGKYENMLSVIRINVLYSVTNSSNHSRARRHNILLYIELAISFLIGRKRTNNTIIMSRTLKVTGNRVMCDRGAWFLRVSLRLRLITLRLSASAFGFGWLPLPRPRLFRIWQNLIQWLFRIRIQVGKRVLGKFHILSFKSKIRGNLKAYLAIEMRLNNI